MSMFGKVRSSIALAMGMSDEHRRFLEGDCKCLQCGTSLVKDGHNGYIFVDYYASDGRKLSGLATLRATVMGCPLCDNRWKMWRLSSGTSPFPIELGDIIETHRSEEFFGEDRRIIDNSKSSTQLTRRFSFTKEWSRSYHVELERTQSAGREFNIGTKQAQGLKLSSEEKLRQTYSVTQDAKETCTEEVSCCASRFRSRSA